MKQNKNMKCSECNTIFEVSYHRWVKRKQKPRAFCCKECHYKFKGFQLPVEINCKTCGKKATKNYKDFIKAKNHFCSKSCSANFYNKLHPKRQLTKKCKSCKCLIRVGKTRCSKCHPTKKVDLTKTTILDLMCNNKNPSAKYNRVREYARKWANKNNYNICEFCGYSFYVELCHIRCISDYNDDTLLCVVNDPKNLLILCPNHHKEFDKGHLSLDEIKKHSYRSK